MKSRASLFDLYNLLLSLNGSYAEQPRLRRRKRRRAFSDVYSARSKYSRLIGDFPSVPAYIAVHRRHVCFVVACFDHCRVSCFPPSLPAWIFCLIIPATRISQFLGSSTCYAHSQRCIPTFHRTCTLSWYPLVSIRLGNARILQRVNWRTIMAKVKLMEHIVTAPHTLRLVVAAYSGLSCSCVDGDPLYILLRPQHRGLALCSVLGDITCLLSIQQRPQTEQNPPTAHSLPRLVSLFSAFLQPPW